MRVRAKGEGEGEGCVVRVRVGLPRAYMLRRARVEGVGLAREECVAPRQRHLGRVRGRVEVGLRGREVRGKGKG